MALQWSHHYDQAAMLFYGCVLQELLHRLALNMLQVVAVIVLLQVRKLPERMPQTLSALAGTGIILGALAFGLLLQADPEVNQPLLGLTYLLLVGWSLAVDAHIYRHALDCGAWLDQHELKQSFG